MNKIVILCVEDESEVRDALERDLKSFAEFFRIETAEDVADAREVLVECEQEGDKPGLVLCDHVMPEVTGVEFLIDLNCSPKTSSVRKVLITGQAMLEDAIKAVNEANLDYYIAKPWTREALGQVVRDQLTEFVLCEENIDLLPFVKVLDGPRLLKEISRRNSDR